MQDAESAERGRVGRASAEAVVGISADRPRGFRWPLPLAVWLGLLTLAAILPSVVLTTVTFVQQVRAEREAEYARLDQLAETLAAAIDRELEGMIDTAQVLAGSRDLARGDLSGFREHAQSAADAAGGSFILVDRDHRQLVNTDRSVDSQLPATTDPAGVVATGRAQVGNIGEGAVAGEPSFAVDLPVVIEGETRYVLSYVPAATAMLEVVRDTYRPVGWFAGVLDGNGVIVARSEQHDEFYGRPANSEFFARLQGSSTRIESVDLEGRSSITSGQRTTLGQWTAVVWAPKSVLEAPADDLARTLSLLFVLALLATVAAAWAAGQMIRKPFSRLARAAHEMGEGGSPDMPSSLVREANVISRALSDAAAGVAARQDILLRNERSMKLVMRELSHRSKNLLAVVQAVVRHSARGTQDFAAFRASLDARLSGLAQSQDLLVSTDWESVALADLAAAQTGSFADPASGRISIAGPPLLLRPEAAQALGMAFHELCTNATKHGALADPQGKVDVTWRVTTKDSMPWLHLRWEESGGRTVSEPEYNGFGSVVIEQLTASNLDGETVLDWRPTGLIWTLDAPLRALLSAGAESGKDATPRHIGTN